MWFLRVLHNDYLLFLFINLLKICHFAIVPHRFASLSMCFDVYGVEFRKKKRVEEVEISVGLS